MKFLLVNLCFMLGDLDKPAAKVVPVEVIDAKISFNAPKKDDVIQAPFTQALEITVKVLMTNVEEVELPEKFTLSGGWKEESRAPAQRGRHLWRQTVQLVALAPGQLPLQPQPLRYRLAGDKTWKTHALPSVVVAVTTTLTDADTKSLRDITAIETLPEVESSRALWWLLLGLVGMMGLAGGIIFLRRRAKAGDTVETAFWALHQLDRLRALDLPAKGQVVRFHHLLANVVRAYVEKRFGMPARRQTNLEFLQSLDLSSCFSADQKSTLRQVLEQCDQARFARQSISMEYCGQTLEMTKKLVTDTCGKKQDNGGKDA